MPENVTRFQPPENVKKSLIRWTHIDIMPSRLPTFFHEEPIIITPAESISSPGRICSRRVGVCFALQYHPEVCFNSYESSATVWAWPGCPAAPQENSPAHPPPVGRGSFVGASAQSHPERFRARMLASRFGRGVASCQLCTHLWPVLGATVTWILLPGHCLGAFCMSRRQRQN